jgi:hypothetical protein
MKTNVKSLLLILALLGAAFLLKGCKLFSLHPLYTPSDLVFIPEITGTWRMEDDETMVMIRAEKDSAYRFTQIDGWDSVHYQLNLTRLGRHIYMDLYPFENCGTFSGTFMTDSQEQGDCSKSENILRNFLPVHSFSRVEMRQDRLVITEFDVDRLKSLFEKNRIRLGHEKLEEEDLILLTASTDDLRKFIVKYADDPKAFVDPVQFVKVR